MSIIVKFIVITPLNSTWIRNSAEQQIKDTYKTPESLQQAENTLLPAFTDESLIWGQNDFSKEMLMAFNEEEPVSSLRLVSNQPKLQELEANKPMYLDMIVHNFSEEGLKALINRAEQIAHQRKYDLLWTSVSVEDTFIKDTFEAFGFKKIENQPDTNTNSSIVFAKQV
nr:hypothetical protein [uncultured Flavobacterium sp.]